MHDPRVIILFGGDGNEHRVSVASAQNVAANLRGARLWYWSLDGVVREVSADELDSFERPFEQDFHPSSSRDWPDVTTAFRDASSDGAIFFLALHGGSGEDGTLQAELESLGHRHTGSDSRSSRLAFDKVRAREVVAEHGILVADACVVDGTPRTDAALDALFEKHRKIVIKPIADGSSHGVRVIDNDVQLRAAVDALRQGAEMPHLAEAFVTGRELTIGVVEDGSSRSPLPCSEVKLDPGRTFDYEGKYLGRGSVELTPAPVSDAVATAAQNIAMSAHQAIGCSGYSRTDVIISPAGPVFLEINTLPGLTAASFIPQQLEAAGILMKTFLENQLALSIQ